MKDRKQKQTTVEESQYVKKKGQTLVDDKAGMKCLTNAHQCKVFLRLAEE